MQINPSPKIPPVTSSNTEESYSLFKIGIIVLLVVAILSVSILYFTGVLNFSNNKSTIGNENTTTAPPTTTVMTTTTAPPTTTVMTTTTAPPTTTVTPTTTTTISPTTSPIIQKNQIYYKKPIDLVNNSNLKLQILYSLTGGERNSPSINFTNTPTILECVSIDSTKNNGITSIKNNDILKIHEVGGDNRYISNYNISECSSNDCIFDYNYPTSLNDSDDLKVFAFLDDYQNIRVILLCMEILIIQHLQII